MRQLRVSELKRGAKVIAGRIGFLLPPALFNALGTGVQDNGDGLGGRHST
jgi:hypothetical protein